MASFSTAPHLDPREQHFRIPGPRHELSLSFSGSFHPRDQNFNRVERSSTFTVRPSRLRFRLPIALTDSHGVTC
jgi:hypothetical protein